MWEGPGQSCGLEGRFRILFFKKNKNKIRTSVNYFSTAKRF